MTRFYDNEKILEIAMYDKETREDLSADFFEDGLDHYNEELDAYKVKDVDYLVDYATDYVNGTNRDIEYPENWEPEFDLVYTVEDRPVKEVD